MLADPYPVVPMPPPPTRSRLARVLGARDERLRPFICPTGLHDYCTPAASHSPAVEAGIAG